MKQEIIAYKQAFPDNDQGIEGTSMLYFAESIEDWLADLKKFSNRETTPAEWVPASQYVLINDEGKILGMLSLRHELNADSENYGGHIGYSVAPSERRKGYGSQMLQLVLKEAKELGMEKILVTCKDTNRASAGVIEKNNGILEDKRTDPESGQMMRRYWIAL